MIITVAKPKDIEGIISVQNSVLIKNLNLHQAQKEGFLVYPISPKQLKGVISNSKNILLCAKDNRRNVIGYILAYDLDNWIKHKPSWKHKIRMSTQIKSSLFDKRTIYLRHIARKKGYKGIGTQLLKYFLIMAKGRNANYIICEILEKYPPNKVSKQFFRKFNFKRVGSITYNDGLTWGLYLLKL